MRHHQILMTTLLVEIEWNYDTQPYVPYTVPQNTCVCVYHENQMYKAQYAFNMSMIMCPAVHMATRSLLRSSSTHEPSDPLSRVKFYISYTQIVYISFQIQITTRTHMSVKISSLPRRSSLEYKQRNRVHRANLVPRIWVCKMWFITPHTSNN